MRRLAAVPLAAVLLLACSGEAGRKPTVSIFVGVDVSGSFVRGGHYDSALEFLSYYLYAHLNAKGDLNPVKALYVGSIGGQRTEETKSFYPIHDFQGKTPGQIHFDLRNWFPQSDKFTDFNIFFRQVASIAQKRNLALSPIEIVLVTDGIPDAPGVGEVPAQSGRYDLIDLKDLEFLSRKVTVRLLYPAPMVASTWENKLPRQRVRMWTVDNQVMMGWRAQLDTEKQPDQQDKLWKWIADNVDYRVRPLKARVRPQDHDASPQPMMPQRETQAPAPQEPQKPAPSPEKKEDPKTPPR